MRRRVDSPARWSGADGGSRERWLRETKSSRSTHSASSTTPIAPSSGLTRDPLTGENGSVIRTNGSMWVVRSAFARGISKDSACLHTALRAVGTARIVRNRRQTPSIRNEGKRSPDRFARRTQSPTGHEAVRRPLPHSALGNRRKRTCCARSPPPPVALTRPLPT